MQALAYGFDLVKFFPAEQAGGIKALRALAGPFPNVRFCPTGGIGEANAATWLAEPNVVAVGGSWLCPAADIRSGNWAGITAMCAADDEVAETGVKSCPIGYKPVANRNRENDHDSQHRRMGAHAVRQVRRRDRREPRGQGRRPRRWRMPAFAPTTSTRSCSAISTPASRRRISPPRWCCRPTRSCASSRRPASRTPAPPVRPRCIRASGRSPRARPGSCWWSASSR